MSDLTKLSDIIKLDRPYCECGAEENHYLNMDWATYQSIATRRLGYVVLEDHQRMDAEILQMGDGWLVVKKI